MKKSEADKAAELAAFRKLKKDLKSLGSAELPENYHEELMDKITQTEKTADKHRRFEMPRLNVISRRLGAAAAVTAVVFALGSLSQLFPDANRGGSSGSIVSAKPSASMDYYVTDGTFSGRIDMPEQASVIYFESGDSVSPESESSLSVSPSGFKPPGEKIQKNIDIVLTVDDLEGAVNAINSLGGYNVFSEINYYNPDYSKSHGYAQIRRRVSENELEFVRGVIRSLGKVTSESENQQDLTNEYIDCLIKSQNAQNEISRLSALLEKSDSLENMFYVNSRISQIDTLMDGYLGTVQRIDAQSDEPYIAVYLSADMISFHAAEESFGDRLVNAAKKSFFNTRRAVEGLALFIAISFVPLLSVFLALFLIFLALKKVLRWGK